MRTLFSIRSLFIVLAMLACSAASLAQVAVGISVSFAPPELPVYDQPLCPGEGYIWTPGYWGWDDDDYDYYWVPGTWVLAPEVGFFWTPGYWGWGGSSFVFYEGYWGPVVGFYGGINYGYGYFGRGYEGGRWDHDHFYYNRTVNNINITEIHNVYNERVNTYTTTRVSFNGGNGGVNVRPTSQEQAAARERHIAPVSAQVQHFQAARTNQSLRASVNHGKPPVAATPRPAAFSDRGVVTAKEGGHYNPPPPRSGNNANRPENNAARSENRPPTSGNSAVRPESNANRPSTDRPSKAIHPKDLPPYNRPPAPNTGNAKVDQKYQQQQQKLQQQQDKERQNLQQKQEQEHQRLTQQKANDARTQQVEQKHQQQTQQLSQKHEQQQQRMQQRQQPPAHQTPPPSQPKEKQKHN